MATIIDGKRVSEKVLSEVSSEISSSGLKPKLAIVLVGENEASKLYVKLKGEACERAGIASENHFLSEKTTEQELLSLLQDLNKGPNSGILVQLPLPGHISTQRAINAVDPMKDVDGIHPQNMGKLLSGSPYLLPCTPAGILRLLEEYAIPLAGKNAVVIGRSTIVGKPMAALLTQKDATVTTCHSKTADISAHTRHADILVSAAGKPNLVGPRMVKRGATVVDVGTTRVAGKIVGDVDFEGVKERAAYITPVPGGVGPMTVAMLLKNTLLACKAQ